MKNNLDCPLSASVAYTSVIVYSKGLFPMFVLTAIFLPLNRVYVITIAQFPVPRGLASTLSSSAWLNACQELFHKKKAIFVHPDY